MSKQVSSYDFNGLKVKSYKSISEASVDTKVAKHVISKICLKRKSYNTSKGFIFAYGSENSITGFSLFRDISNNAKKVDEFDMKGNFIKTHESAASAARERGVTGTAVCANARGETMYCKSRIFKFNQ